MDNFSGLLVVAIAIAVGILFAADLYGLDIIGNAILKRLSLQDKPMVGRDLIGRKTKVVSIDGSKLRAELNGVPWAAQSMDSKWIPVEGEMATVVAVSGLTLMLSKEGTQLSSESPDKIIAGRSRKETN